MAKVISQLPSGGSVPKHNNLLGLNEGDYLHLTQFEKAKLDGIQSGAEVNVNADWNAVSGDAQLLNKPLTFPPSVHTHLISEVVNLENELNGKVSTNALDDLQLNKEDKANKNIANGYAGLDSSGKIIPTQLPALAITDTFVVASQTEQLALVAEVGDVAVRTDLNKSFILRVTGASTLANWQELLSPTSVDQTIIDGSTNAVSGNAVFDALATKAPISSVHNPVTIGTANGLSLSNQQLSLGLASSSTTGALSGTDWNTFNNKQNALGYVPEIISNKSDSFTASSSTTYASTKALVDGLADKERTISPKKTAFNKNFGTTAGTVAEGNDSRLSDSRTPTAGSGSYIQNQNASAQSANMWINGRIGWGNSVDNNYIEISPVNGTNFVGKTGSTNDFVFHNGLGQGVIENPTGTQNVVFKGSSTFSSSVTTTSLPVFENNAAASSLTVGQFYRTSIGVLMVKF